VDERVKKDQGKKGKQDKRKDSDPGLAFFEEVIQRDKKQSPEKQVVLEAEPEKGREEKAHKEIVEDREGFLGAELPENIYREKGDGDFGIEMSGEE
jgi:hypothetical protein